MGIIYNTCTGNVEGRLRNKMIFSPFNITTVKRRELNIRLKISERLNTLTDSLSVLGSTIALSYLRDEITIIIPIRLRYTEYIPKDSGEKNRRRKGWRRIDINWAITVPEINIEALRRSSDRRR